MSSDDLVGGSVMAPVRRCVDCDEDSSDGTVIVLDGGEWVCIECRRDRHSGEWVDR